MTVLFVALVLVGLSGCNTAPPAPDLSDQAEDIGARLSTMPGVENVRADSRNDYSPHLEYSVTMATDAGNDDITNVADKLNQSVGAEYDDYFRMLTFRLEELTINLSGEPDVAKLKHRLPQLKELRADLSDGTIRWKHNSETDYDTALEVVDTDDDAFAVMSATRRVFGSEEFRLTLRRVPQGSWELGLPYSADAQKKLEAALEKADPQVRRIKIADDQVSSLQVTARDEPGVSQRLSAIIEEVDAVNHGCWGFSWQEKDTKSVPGFFGRLSVGECACEEDVSGETDSTKDLTPNAITVRDELRAKYGACS